MCPSSIALKKVVIEFIAAVIDADIREPRLEIPEPAFEPAQFIGVAVDTALVHHLILQLFPEQSGLLGTFG